ncbi:hypothetical protein AWZ03_001400 [Drosophila navojoa]|uniref:Uncharacterized protein n=1 Tax=Drosophila navojoa TaxID=7232 RepID=A0A484BTJ1_DRONA|nr:hypothetical protein AWZ03_001400 [Drosophila navojoa]
MAGGRTDGAGKYATIFVLLIYTLIKAISLNTKRKQLPAGRRQTADGEHESFHGQVAKWGVAAAVEDTELAARPLTWQTIGSSARVPVAGCRDEQTRS